MQHQEIPKVFIISDKKTKEILACFSNLVRAEDFVHRRLETSFDHPDGLTTTIVPLDEDWAAPN